jgi:hypothetical protein
VKRYEHLLSLKVCDNDILIQLLYFWILSILLVLFKTQNVSKTWILSSSSATYSWAQVIGLVPILGHKIRYINQAEHKQPMRVKTNIYNIKKLSTHDA